MMKYKCILVDDEPIAIRIVRNYLSNFDEFEIVAECSNAIEAMKVMRTEKVDLLFLDIEMPQLNGIEMLKTLPYIPSVIYTTAHRNYAVEAFEQKALDYLMKPISMERFTSAINRFLDLKSHVQTHVQLRNQWVILKVDKKNVKLQLETIQYVESMSDYIIVHTDESKLVCKDRISHFEEKLPSSDFIRVHRSYIINKLKVSAWYGNTIEIGSIKIPVGRNYKAQVEGFLSK
ncbi:MAG: LytTR family DNA-binding domain-containing protein [Prolixibacteraceae bacterium]|jgi:DNA-binding LytR/AlgR family response regulator|nr:LytTR family DNA-binding domain-containing protein [Prolixibacteraceae bacterium]